MEGETQGNFWARPTISQMAGAVGVAERKKSYSQMPQRKSGGKFGSEGHTLMLSV